MGNRVVQLLDEASASGKRRVCSSHRASWPILNPDPPLEISYLSPPVISHKTIHCPLSGATYLLHWRIRCATIAPPSAPTPAFRKLVTTTKPLSTERRYNTASPNDRNSIRKEDIITFIEFTPTFMIVVIAHHLIISALNNSGQKDAGRRFKGRNYILKIFWGNRICVHLKLLLIPSLQTHCHRRMEQIRHRDD